MCRVKLCVSSMAQLLAFAQVCRAAAFSLQVCLAFPTAPPARDSKLPAGSAHPWGCGDPGGLSPPNLWGASVWAFPWQWGRNPVPLGLGKVRGGGKAVPLCALNQKQADPPWRRLCLSDVFPGFQRIFTHRELGVPPREPGSKQVRVCRGDEISHWRTLSMRTVK